jgi:4-aminobutyrate--pyruvate transaminase
VGPTLVNKFAHEHGLIIRPVADAACFCPPMICSEAQITEMFGRYGRALKDTHDWLKREGHA